MHGIHIGPERGLQFNVLQVDNPAMRQGINKAKLDFEKGKK
jgi:hypothetical protein